MSTHYLPSFTVAGSDGTQRSACGHLIYPSAHSTEPTCPACAAYLERGAPPETTSVLVRQRVTLASLGVSMVTDWTHARATADQFDPGILTITADDGTVLKTFDPDAWESVTVLDPDGYERFAFRNDVAWQSHVENRKLRRRSA